MIGGLVREIVRCQVFALAVALSLAACADQSSRHSGDPVRDAEASCMKGAYLQGNVPLLEWCAKAADQMRARRAALPATAARETPDGPITWIAPSMPPVGAEITLVPLQGGKEIFVVIQGEIVQGDALRAVRAFDEAADRYPAATGGGVLLDSPGGSVREAALIGSAIARADIPVAVPADAECASACFLIFAAARRKFASRAARIGVHSVTNGSTGIESTSAMATTTELGRALAGVGVPAEIIGRMVTTPPGQVAWLSNAELLSMGVRLVP